MTPPRLTRRAALTGLAALAAAPARLAAAAGREVAYGSHPLQRYDIYMPEGAQAAPLVVFLHGGGWRIGDKSNPDVWRAKSRHWNGRGLGFVALNTRLLPEVDPLQQAADLGRAVAHIQQNAQGWGADPARIALMGHSAGAHLVSLLGADPGLARQWGASGWRCTVSLDTAVYDTERYMAFRPLPIHRRAFGTSRAFWARTSPRARLGTGTAPFLLVCSQRPQVLSQARNFARSVKVRGGSCDILETTLSHARTSSAIGEDASYTATIDSFMAAHGVG